MDKKNIITIAAVAVGGLLVGGGIGYASVAPQLADVTAERDSLTSDLEDMTTERDEALDARDAAVADYTEKVSALGEREDKIKERETAADERSTELDEREAAIAKTEARIAEESFSGGMLVVGQDIAAGEYRTTSANDCYYAWKTSTSSDADIIDNNIVSGTVTVTLRDGDVFESRRCGTWNKIG